MKEQHIVRAEVEFVFYVQEKLLEQMKQVTLLATLRMRNFRISLFIK